MTSKTANRAESRAEKAISEEAEASSTAVPWFIAAICVGWVCFQLYTAMFGVLPPLQQRSVHLIFGAILLFALHASRHDASLFNRVTSLVLMVMAAASIGYVAVNHFALWNNAGSYSTADILAASAIVLCVIEAARRSIGIAIPLIALASIVYCLVGPWLPSPFFHSGYSLQQIVTYQSLGLQGIFGTAIGVIASFVFLYILYAGLLQVTGAGELFIGLATGLFGFVRGGPAKIAVFASAAFGSISGSAVANVATTGAITIPLMKRVGYRRRFAAAVEAVASSGGQFTPPLMGASAFLIAEVLAMPFYQVAIAAAIPAALYFISVYFSVDIEAKKDGLKGIPKDELPSVGRALKSGWPLLISPLVLVILLVVVQYSPMRSAVITIFVTVGTTLLSKSTRLSLKQYVEVAVAGAKGSIEISIACASVGIIIGTMAQTGLGFQLSGILIDASMGYLIVLLLLTMLTSIVLGMGLPTVAAYLVLSVSVAPALVEYGVNPLAAHLFIFYFGIVSAITPPVALASMVASSIAKAGLWETSLDALRIATPAFILPFMFVYNDALILQGQWHDTLLGVGTAIIGVWAIAASTRRYLFNRLGWIETIALLVLGCVLVSPGLVTAGVGIVGITIIAAINWKFGKQSHELRTGVSINVD